MARGFDSKSVEYQQEEAQRSREQGTERPLSEEERARAQRQATLALARARTAADLRASDAPVQRAMLRRALRALDEELASLGDD